MKMFLNLLIAQLFFMNTALAGLPPTTLKGQSTSKVTTFNFEVPNSQATKTSTGSLIETGNTNLVANPGFEGATFTECSFYDDGDSATPLDGTGDDGARTNYLSIGTQSSTMGYGTKEGLITKASGDARGQGIACSFTAPAGVRLTVRGKYTTSANYADYNAAFPSSDMGIYVYDVTNSALLYPAIADVPANAGKATYNKVFHLTSGSGTISGRILFHVQTTNSSAWTMPIDERFAGEDNSATGPPVIDEKDYSGVSWRSGWTMTNQVNKYSRVGNKALFTFSATTNTPAATSLFLTLPNTIDVAKLGITGTQIKIVGKAQVRDSAASPRFQGLVAIQASNPTVLFVYYLTQASTTYVADNNVTSTAPVNLVSTDFIEITTDWLPIVGWGSSSGTSEDFSAMPVSFIASGYNAQTISSTASTVIFPTEIEDRTSNYDSTTGIFTAPESEIYSCSFNHTFQTGGTASTRISAYLVSSNASYANYNPGTRLSDLVANSTYDVHGDGIFRLNRGDTVKVQASSVTQDVSTVNTTIASFGCFKVSNSQAIIGSEPVSARYSGAPPTGTLNSGFNTVTFGTKSEDTHGAYSGGSYTVPVTGRYNITAQVRISGTYALNNAAFIGISINGSLTFQHIEKAGGANDELVSSVSASSVFLTQGQIITIVAASNATSPAYVSNASSNYFTIIRVGSN